MNPRGGRAGQLLQRRRGCGAGARTALPHARASLAHAQRASSAARRALGVETGELHVGTLYSISTGILPGALRTWRRDHPELQVHLVELRHTDDLIAVMQAGQADVAVGPTTLVTPTHITARLASRRALVSPRDRSWA